MSQRIEDELRALLQARAATVADVGDPVTGVETGVRRVVARRRLVVGVGVPVVVAAIVAGASVLPGHPQQQVTGGTAAPSAAAAASSPASTSPMPVASVATPSVAVTASATPVTAPSSSTPTTAQPVVVQTPQVEVFRTYLEVSPAAHKAGASFAGHGGRIYCALRVLDQSAHQADLAVFCQEYYLNGEVLTQGSGSFVPARLTFTGAGAATRVTAIAVPHSGQAMMTELQALFSPLALGRWVRFYDGELAGPGLDESAAELSARAAADVQSGRLRARAGG